jgi:hypothetical protein
MEARGVKEGQSAQERTDREPCLRRVGLSAGDDAYNSSTGCPNWGTYRPWSSTKIKELYPTHDDYVAKVKAWADYEVTKRWLLPEDRDDAVVKAQAFNEPWVDSTCYDTYNEEANESGPLSSQIGGRWRVPPRAERGFC